MSELPLGWRQVSLQEITTERNERVGGRREVTVLSSTKHHGLVPSNEYFKNRTIYSNDLSAYKLVCRDWFAYATNHLAEGSIGLQQSFDVACVSPIYTVFSCKDDVHPPYMFRLLKSPELMAKYAINEQASVDRRGAVRYRDFGNIEVVLPLKSEQERIAEILDTLDLQISSVDLLINKLQLIGNGIAASQFERLNQADTPVVRLSSVARVSSGVTLGTETGGAIEVPYLRVANVQDGYIDTTEMKTIRVSRADMRRYLLQAGDVLLTEGGDFDKLGRGAVWDGRIDPCICQNHIFRVRCDQSQVIPNYLAAYTASAAGKRYFLSIAKQTTNLATINSTQLKAMPLPLPSLAAQRELVAVLESHKMRIAAEVGRRDQLLLLKKGLMEDLLTGRVRVSEAEAILEGL